MNFLILILVFLAAYLIALDVLNVPSLKKKKAIYALHSAEKKNSTFKIILNDLSELLSRFIRINPYKRQVKKDKLIAAGIIDTPEVYTAKSLVKAFGVLLTAIISFFVFSPVIGFLLCFLAVLTYFLGDDNLNHLIAERKEKIEADINPFVSHIAKSIAHNKDVIFLMENYIQYCGPELGEQLRITVADMRSGNDKNALQRFEARVNSKELSEVTRGLIAVLSGDDTSAYWVNLEIKFSQLQRQRLLRQAEKIPGKVFGCTLVVALCFIVMTLTAMIVTMGSSLDSFF